MKTPTINILTRTASRPIGFLRCHSSISNQTYKKTQHIVSYENDSDYNYIKGDNIVPVKVNKIEKSNKKSASGYIHAPYNLHCNKLLEQVKEGWVMFLDDDDNLLHNKVFKEIVDVLKNCNEETLLIWKMRYPDGRTLPEAKNFKDESIQINKIGSCCFMFHSKYKDEIKWDEWKGSDFRFLNGISKKIPNKMWINRVYIQINNFGDFGKQNDVDSLLNTCIYNKNWNWYLLPKYHMDILGLKIFSKTFYSKLKNRIFR
ncbi:hypothetical protein A8C32_00780 [Flavivirga aquatica]|uniref:Glycosyltransferase 2-like domain-containing protein n=1 Tax=Flavivirga aquatica TaxID=1849968 RepID=A0A1E5TBS4_9FLAO|nr:hypothetical protein [Flavivirga aquatica]OEK08843.1 hypothetical protein A8C32_00780 [Flavivirga aquatica]